MIFSEDPSLIFSLCRALTTDSKIVDGALKRTLRYRSIHLAQVAFDARALDFRVDLESVVSLCQYEFHRVQHTRLSHSLIKLDRSLSA